MAKKDKEEHGPESSADDIIEQLAQEMGVDDDDDPGTDDDTTSDDASDDDDGGSVSEEADDDVDGEDEGAAHGYSHEELMVANSPPMTNEEAIEKVFGPEGRETPLGKMPELADEDDLRRPNRGPIYLVAVLLLGVGALAGVYFGVLSEEERQCLQIEISGRSCQDYHQALEDERQERERLERLAQAPKYGTVMIITEPKALHLTSEGQPAYVFPGTRTDLMVPARTALTFADIPVDAPFEFTIHGGGNFEDKIVVIPPFDDPNSPWVQDQFSGDYNASLMYTVCWPGSADAGAPHCLTPAADRARELQWRMNWEPPLDAEPAPGEEEVQTRLLGSITVTSDPPGALISYNGRQLWNEETGEPYVTPHTFSTFNAPMDREDDRTPSDVYLSREGMPIAVMIEGKLPTTDGVYIHQFLCEPREGVEPPAEVDPNDPNATPESWIEYCNYTYNVHLVLSDPPPPEGSGEGSGAAAAPAAE